MFAGCLVWLINCGQSYTIYWQLGNWSTRRSRWVDVRKSIDQLQSACHCKCTQMPKRAKSICNIPTEIEFQFIPWEHSPRRCSPCDGRFFFLIFYFTFKSNWESLISATGTPSTTHFITYSHWILSIRLNGCGYTYVYLCIWRQTFYWNEEPEVGGCAINHDNGDNVDDVDDKTVYPRHTMNGQNQKLNWSLWFRTQSILPMQRVYVYVNSAWAMNSFAVTDDNEKKKKNIIWVPQPKETHFLYFFSPFNRTSIFG